MLKSVSPGNITHNSKDEKNHVLKTGKDEVFVKIQGNRGEIGNDPPGPVFQLFLVHQPHSGECSAGSETVSNWYCAIRKMTEQKIEDSPTGEEKNKSILPVFFC